MQRWLASLFLLLPLAASADDAPGTDTALTVKPLLCIVDTRTPDCHIRFLIEWQSRATGYYCVNNELEADPLRCWDEARSGRHEDERTVSATFRYWLDHGRDDTELAAATVEVLQKDSDDRRRRRRTKYVWDLL